MPDSVPAEKIDILLPHFVDLLQHCIGHPAAKASQRYHIGLQGGDLALGILSQRDQVVVSNIVLGQLLIDGVVDDPCPVNPGLISGNILDIGPQPQIQ